MSTSLTAQLSPKASTFIDSVLALQPTLAAFDCDGTLWSGDAGEAFFRWELERGLVPEDVAAWVKTRHDEYLAGGVSEDDMCGEMVAINKGRSDLEMMAAAREFFDSHMVDGIFLEMQTLVRCLHDSGCKVWAVSSSNEWVIRAGMSHFHIPESRVLAASVAVENGVVTDKLVRVPSGVGKPIAILEVAKRAPDASFGNSRWDVAMLEMAKNAFAVNPNPDLESLATARNWAVYWPDATAK